MATSEKQITAIPKEKILSQSTKTSQGRKGSLNKSTSKTDLEDNKLQGTVLLRHPLPKYSFQISNAKKNDRVKISADNGSKKTEVVTASVLPNVRNEKTEGTAISQLQKPVSKVDPLRSVTNGASVSRGAVRDVNVDLNISVGERSSLPTVLQTGASLSSVTTNNNDLSTEMQFESLPFPQPVSSHSEINCCQHEDELKRLQDEVNSLKNQLDVQVKVNGELKKLLVASVGDDLHSRVEHLARDRAQMALELGDFTKKIVEDYENLDKIAIQADMWRSKYLASRVMSDELATAKAFFAMQLQESQHAIQQLLNERHELRTNLLETCRCLQQVKSAFDPLNSQRSPSLPSSNAIDLAKMNKELSESIRYRLLPSTVPLQTSVNMDICMEDTFTKAESYAQELLSKRVTFDQSAQSAPGSSVIDRYHPYTNFENLTLNCCAHCKGEISAL